MYLKSPNSYKNFINKNNISSKKIEKLLKKAKRNSVLSNFFYKSAVILFFGWLLFGLGYKVYYYLNEPSYYQVHNATMGDFLSFSIGFAIFPLFFGFIFSKLEDYNLSKLEDEIFEKFIKNRVKVFQTIEFAQEYSYDIIDEDNLSSDDNFKEKKYLYFKAVDIGAEGYIILRRHKYSMVKGSITEVGGYIEGEISSEEKSETEVVFIKNIRRK